jgi:hypothetical protein
MIGLNFRESPPTRSQHIRGDARSRHAGVHPVLVPGGLIEGNYSLRGRSGSSSWAIFTVLSERQPPSIFKAQKFQLFLPAAGAARYWLSPQSIV